MAARFYKHSTRLEDFVDLANLLLDLSNPLVPLVYQGFVVGHLIGQLQVLLLFLCLQGISVHIWNIGTEHHW